MTILCDASETSPLDLGVPAGECRRVATLDEAAAVLANDQHELLVVVGSDVALPEALLFTAEQRVVRPALGVVLMRHVVTVPILTEAIRSGVREVVSGDGPASVHTACAASLEISRQLRHDLGGAVGAPGGGARKLGEVVTVFAGKGGCGKTTIATNLAVALAAGGRRRVCLVDLDLAFGDVAIMLRLVPRRSVADAVAMADELDETGFRSLLTPYAAGVDVLLAPPNPVEAEGVTRDLVTGLLALARQAYDVVVVDTPPHFTDHVLAALDVSSHYVLLTTPDVPTLKNLRVVLDMFDLLGYREDRRLVVLNRSDAKVGLTPGDIEGAIRTRIGAHVPSSRDVPIAVNRGVPIVVSAPDHAVSAAIRGLAAKLDSAGVVSASGKGARRLFRSRSRQVTS